MSVFSATIGILAAVMLLAVLWCAWPRGGGS